MKTIFIQSYEIAVEIAEKHKDSKFYSAAVQFLKDCKASEQLTGDDDNPFNSDVHDFIQVEEQFKKELNVDELHFTVESRENKAGIKGCIIMVYNNMDKLPIEVAWFPKNPTIEQMQNWVIFKVVAYPK